MLIFRAILDYNIISSLYIRGNVRDTATLILAKKSKEAIDIMDMLEQLRDGENILSKHFNFDVKNKRFISK